MSDHAIKSRFNWWMLAFLVSLLAFEIMRELLVIATNEPKVGDNLVIHGNDSLGYASARGQWVRSDGGSPILPGTVTIDCFKQENMCIEASSTYMPNSRSAPIFVETFKPTEFDASGVTYENDEPGCAKYTVRIDLAQKRVLATRTRKANSSMPNCAKLEERVAMELGSGFDQINSNWMSNHFLPVFNTIRAFNK